METIHIRMLGEFSLTCGSIAISDTSSRSRKIWGLLAYLICHREQPVSQKKLMELFWNGSANPENALRITLHRIRALLDTLFPGAGRQLILYKEGQCSWNREYPVLLDCDRFDDLLKHSDVDSLLEALELYRGEFLPQLASEIWVIPICAHYGSRYLDATLEASKLLSQRQQYPEAAAICRRAIAAEPYHEPLHRMLMQVLSAAGDYKGAAAVYETLNQRLNADFGIHPSEETRSVYRASIRPASNRVLAIEEVLEQLKEPTGQTGAMLCDYDSFKVLCYAACRDIENSEHPVHLALINITGTQQQELSRRSSNRIMEQLGQLLRKNLYRGDVIAQCSPCQYILLLPKTSYETSCLICRRVIGAFTRAHPNVAAELHFVVQALTPGISVP